MSYTVNLINFVGPLDLLLQLIEKQDLDITEVSLSTITGDYLDYTRQLEVEAVDLDWFSQLASKLVLIKSRSLVGQSQAEDEGSAEDQLADLAEQLQRYRIYQRASQLLSQRLQNNQFARPMPAKQATAPQDYKNIVSPALSQVLARLQTSGPTQLQHRHYVAPKIPVAAKTRQLKQLLVRPRRLDEILSAELSQLELIGNLLALLELIKQRLVRIQQTEGGVIVSREPS